MSAPGWNKAFIYALIANLALWGLFVFMKRAMTIEKPRPVNLYKLQPIAH